MKRLFDIIFSLIGILICFPIFLIVPIFIKIESSGPAFFMQERAGKNFSKFKIIKFRSMISDSSKNKSLITVANDNRITKVGKFLRKTKIDELPQLINVLIGDMSFVGPRPEVFRYVEIFKEDYQNILKVKPGITDYAAIEYSDEEKVLKKYENSDEGYIKEVLPQKIKLYKKYISEQSFFNDIKIIFKTIYKIIK